jgi:hypothetical protein
VAEKTTKNKSLIWLFKRKKPTRQGTQLGDEKKTFLMRLKEFWGLALILP